MIDSYGLLVEQNLDGGDSPHRTGIYISCLAFQDPSKSQPFIYASQKYQMIAPGVYIRHPINYNDLKDFSRDQASRLMLGYGVARRPDLMKQYYALLLKNGFKHPNGDLLGISEVINIIRAYDMWYFYPALLVLDCKYFVDLIARKIDPWGYDALFLPDLYYALQKYWTPIAWLASKIYKLTDAPKQIWDNFLNPDKNGCDEVGNALLSLFQNL